MTPQPKPTNEEIAKKVAVRLLGKGHAFEKHYIKEFLGALEAKDKIIAENEGAIKELQEELSWRILQHHYLTNKITDDQLLDITEKETEHPDWWEEMCYCYECRSCG